MILGKQKRFLEKSENHNFKSEIRRNQNSEKSNQKIRNLENQKFKPEIRI